jgi:hypothetical protein
MLRRTILLLAVTAIVLPVLAQEKTKDAATVTGKFFNYDRDKKTLTIAPLTGDAKPSTFLVDKGTEIFIDGKRGAINAVPDNHPIRVTLNADRTVVVRLSAEGPTQKRKVLGVNRDRFALQLDRGSDTEEVPVAKDAEIVVNGKDAKFEDLQPGDEATIRFAIDRKTIRGIQVGLPKPESGKLPVKD